jgi:hypothetical protein
MTRQEIQKQFENTIKKETGQDVEITFIASDEMSVWGTPEAVRLAHAELLSMVDSLSFIEQESCPEVNAECAFSSF